MRLMFRKILHNSSEVCILLMQHNSNESGMLKMCTKLVLWVQICKAVRFGTYSFKSSVASQEIMWHAVQN